VRLAHLALVVRDERRSRAFYEAWFGFGAGRSWRADDGTLFVRDADGFDLALHAGEPGALPGFFHFGFRLPDPEAVRALAARLVAAGVTVVERSDEPAYVSLKCLDPDGYTVEAYWEPLTAR
jgi:catechol 2,3-dioxygenase-like lactoylglutathione lyase family enzyme